MQIPTESPELQRLVSQIIDRQQQAANAERETRSQWLSAIGCWLDANRQTATAPADKVRLPS